MKTVTIYHYDAFFMRTEEALSQRFPYDIEAYIKGKEHLVLEIERNALVWHQETNM